MAEILTLAAPVVPPSTTTWAIDEVVLSVGSPAIRVTMVSNTGERFVYRYVPSDSVTIAQVNTALSFINQGKFQTVQGKSLLRWLLDKISADGVKVGTVSGIPL